MREFKPREDREFKKRDAKDKVKILRKKKCRFCVDKIEDIDYKQIYLLKKFVTERGKIMPRRITGNCAYHQRMLTGAIKLARNIALMPYSAQ